ERRGDPGGGPDRGDRGEEHRGQGAELVELGQDDVSDPHGGHASRRENTAPAITRRARVQPLITMAPGSGASPPSTVSKPPNSLRPARSGSQWASGVSFVSSSEPDTSVLFMISTRSGRMPLRVRTVTAKAMRPVSVA